MNTLNQILEQIIRFTSYVKDASDTKYQYQICCKNINIKPVNYTAGYTMKALGTWSLLTGKNKSDNHIQNCQNATTGM